MGWSQPATAGPMPEPRMGHSSAVVGHNIIVLGGFYFRKQDALRAGSMLKELFLGVLKVLDTESLTWSRLRVTGTPP